MANRVYPDIASVIRTDMKWNFGGNGGGVRFFHSYSTTDNQQSTYDGWCNWVTTTYTNQLAQVVHTNITLIRVIVTDLSNRTAPTSTQSANAPGLLTGTQPPDNACVLVNYKIHRRYRGGQPRGYFPGGNAADISNGNSWSGTFLGQFQTAINGFFNGLLQYGGNLVGLTHINIGYFDGSTWHQDALGNWKQIPNFASPPHQDKVQSTPAATRVGSQRRRLALGG